MPPLPPANLGLLPHGLAFISVAVLPCFCLQPPPALLRQPLDICLHFAVFEIEQLFVWTEYVPLSKHFEL